MIDDSSVDGSAQYIKKTVLNYPRVNNRLFLLENKQQIGALGNKDMAVRNYCEADSIIVEFDADDALIGTQVLNVLSRIYSK